MAAVSNQPAVGVAPAPSPAPAEKPSAAPQQSSPSQPRPPYRVQPDETVDTVSKQFGVSNDDLFAANPKLQECSRLMPGDVLTIPEPGAQAYRSGASSAPDAPQAPAQAAATPASTYTREQARQDAKTLHEATDGGLTGYGTTESDMFQVLHGKSKQELDILREEYQKQYGQSLDEVARGDTSGVERERVDLLLQGAEVTGAKSTAMAIGAEIESRWADEKVVLDHLEKATPQQRAEIVKEYAAKYGPPAAGQSAQEFFMSRLERKFNAEEMAQAKGLLEAKDQHSAPASAAKIHQAFGLVSNDKETIKSVLEGKSPEQIKEIDSAYQSQYGESLKSAIERKSSGADRDVLLRQLDPPTTPEAHAQASAERLHAAIEGVGTRLPEIRQELQGKTQEELQAIKTAYEKRTGETLENAVKGDTSGPEQDEVLHLMNRPADSDPAALANWKAQASAKAMRVAVEGAGTDEARVREVLEKQSKPENEAMGKAYKEMYGEDLRERLDSELDGRDNMELVGQLYDRGAATTSEEKMLRLKEKREFEQFGLGFSSVMQKVARADFSYESDANRMDRHIQQYDNAVARGDTAAAEAEVDYTQNDYQSTVSTREAATDALATTAGIALSVAAEVGTVGAASPFLSVAWAARIAKPMLTGGLTATVVQTVTNHQAGTTETLRKGVVGSVSGAPITVGTGVAQKLGQKVLQQTGRQSLARVTEGVAGSAIPAFNKGAIDGAAQAGTNSDTWKDGTGLGTGAADTLRSAIGGVLQSGVQDATKKLLKGLTTPTATTATPSPTQSRSAATATAVGSATAGTGTGMAAAPILAPAPAPAPAPTPAPAAQPSADGATATQTPSATAEGTPSVTQQPSPIQFNPATGHWEQIKLMCTPEDPTGGMSTPR